MSALATTDKAERVLVPDEKAILMIETCANSIFRASTIKDVEKEITKAEAIAAVVRSMNASERVKRDAEFLRVRGERRLGEITASIPRTTTSPSNKTSPELTKMATEALGKGVLPKDVAAQLGLGLSAVQQMSHRIKRGLPPHKHPGFEPGHKTKGQVLAENGVSLVRARRAEQLAKPPPQVFEAALANANPNVFSVTKNLGAYERHNRIVPRVGHSALAEEAIALLDACCKASRAPRRDEVNKLQLRLAALNVVPAPSASRQHE